MMHRTGAGTEDSGKTKQNKTHRQKVEPVSAYVAMQHDVFWKGETEANWIHLCMVDYYVI